jgi:hypothetical protein
VVGDRRHGAGGQRVHASTRRTPISTGSAPSAPAAARRVARPRRSSRRSGALVHSGIPHPTRVLALVKIS